MADKPTKNTEVKKEAVKEVKKEVAASDKATAPKEDKVSYYEAVGRRKTASARARLYVVKDATVTISGKPVEKGAMIVNGLPVEKFFPGEVFKKRYQEPFRTTNTMSRFAVSVTTTGGGLTGQLGATIHALSRALIKVDVEKFRPILKKRGFLMRDPRAKQRRKAGFAGKARARKQSPKR
jgi:small subunit ribosomal protein S9